MKKIAFPNDILMVADHSGLEDDRLIDVGIFEDLPFSDEYTVINQWLESDIFDLLVKEGHISKEERLISKIGFVRTSRYKNISTVSYTVGISIMTEKIGFIYRYIDNMDAKIRDIKLKRILPE